MLGLNALIGGAQRLGTNRALRALRTTSTGQIRRLLEAAAVEVDESSLTGESALVPAP